MFKKLILILLGIGQLIIVIFLGLKATNNNAYVIWFGLAAAILAPGGVASLSYVFTSGEHDLVKQLSKVPEIDNLMEKAKSQEEKIRLLEEERSRLSEIIQKESRKQAIAQRKESLEEDAKRILNDLKTIDSELSLLGESVGTGSASNEVKQLEERLQANLRGDLVFRHGSHSFILERDLIIGLFPAGRLIYSLLHRISLKSQRYKNKGNS